MQLETPIPLVVSSLVAACALAAIGLAQEARSPSTATGASRLQPVQAPGQLQDASRTGSPLRPFAGSTDSASDDGVALENELRQRLTTTDLDARMDAFQDVAEKAAAEPAMRRALRSVADDQADVDLAFSARLALREADRIAGGGADRGRAGRPLRTQGFGSQGLSSQGLGAPRDLVDPMDAMEIMQRQLDQIFGPDPFRSGAFGNDPFFNDPFFNDSLRGRAGSRPGARGMDAFGGEDPFQELESRVEDMRRRMREARGGRSGLGTGRFIMSPGLRRSQSSSINVSITPDGIRVEVTEDDGDGPKKTVYEAPAKEQLLELHPELKDRLR